MTVTSSDFRHIALGFPEVIEGAHMDHPDFRIGGKIFATIGYAQKGCAIVKLPPNEQVLFIEAEPDVFTPAKGAWGRRGATIVLLRAAKKPSLEKALLSAWRNLAPKRLTVESR